MSTAGIVLAGGRSSRMGSDKALLPLGGVALLQWAVRAVAEAVDEVVVVGAPNRALPPIECQRPLVVVRDPIEGEGPLAGIVAGLEATEADSVLVVACDQPFVRSALLQYLLGQLESHVAAVPVFDGRPQPLCSAVSRSVVPMLRAAFEEGERAAMVIVESPGALLVQPDQWRHFDPEGRSFVGVNTPDEFARAEASFQARGL
jgi:molybdopterin-guanine dinucleotide biosynthesis protein A